jgi:uncharacterized membrane protein YeaQ/YmgE (transglycosylase-associated protein family)
MGLESIFATLFVGAVAGWLAGRLVKGDGFGLLGNIVIGILGAAVAGFVLPIIGLRIGGFPLGDIINATIGSIILLIVVRTLKKV